MLACEYIAKSHVPPAKYLVQQSPPMSSPGNSSEPMSSPTADARLATRIKASAEILIPLSEEHWQFVTILHNDGSNVSWRTAGGQQFTTPVDVWREQLKPYGDIILPTLVSPTYSQIHKSSTTLGNLSPTLPVPRHSKTLTHQESLLDHQLIQERRRQMIGCRSGLLLARI